MSDAPRSPISTPNPYTQSLYPNPVRPQMTSVTPLSQCEPNQPSIFKSKLAQIGISTSGFSSCPDPVKKQKNK